MLKILIMESYSRMKLSPSRPDPWRRELKFLFAYFFVVPQKVLKAFIKPFEAPQRNVKIKI